MSKSKNNYIPIFGSEEDIRKSVMSIVTDSARPEEKKDSSTNNIYNIHKLFLNNEEAEILKKRYEESSPENPFGYADAKKECAKAIINYFSNMTEKYTYYKNNEEEVRQILLAGALKANQKAAEMMLRIKRDTGLNM